MNFKEVRPFGVPNLTRDAEIYYAVPTDPTVVSTDVLGGLVPENLIKNVNFRASGVGRQPPDPPNSDKFCYRVRKEEMFSERSGFFELTLKLKERQMVNAIILVQDAEIGADFDKHYLWKFRIIVGDDPDWRKNYDCSDTPYLEDETALSQSNHAMEIWCNISGQYVSLIRSYQDYPDIVSVTICDFAIMGGEP